MLFYKFYIICSQVMVEVEKQIYSPAYKYYS